MLYRVLVIDPVGIGNAEIVFSSPSPLELAVHQDGPFPGILSDPKGEWFLDFRERNNDRVLFANNPTTSKIKSFASLFLFAPKTHLEVSLCLVCDLGFVSLQCRKQVFD